MDETTKPATSLRQAYIIVAVLMIIHVALAIWYASVTPWRTGGAVFGQYAKDIGAPDERQHVNYIQRLANGEGFPVFDPKDPNLYETYQSHQPPAFYVLATGWSKLTGVDFVPAPVPGFGMSGEPGGIDKGENALKMRALNAFVGAGTVLGVFFLGLWGFRRWDIGVVAASFAALLPMNVALSGAVSNDPMLICLCTWVLALAAKGMTQGWTWKVVAATGLLTGLAMLTKTTAVSLLPILLLAALLPQKQKPSVAKAGALVGIVILVAGGWWIRNQSLYGDPLAMKAFTDAFQGSAQKSTIVAQIQASGDGSPEMTYWKDWIGWWSARSFFGAFGYMDIWMNESGRAISATDKNTIYRLLIVGLIVALLGWVLATAKTEVKNDWPVQVVNGAFILVVTALFIRFNTQYFQAQARYFLPALGPISCGVGIGAVYLAKQKWQAALAVVAIVLLGVNLYAVSMLPAEFAKRIEVGNRMPH